GPRRRPPPPEASRPPPGDDPHARTVGGLRPSPNPGDPSARRHKSRGEVPGGDPPRGKLRTWSGLDGCSHKQRTEWRGSASLGTPPRDFLWQRINRQGAKTGQERQADKEKGNQAEGAAVPSSSLTPLLLLSGLGALGALAV